MIRMAAVAVAVLALASSALAQDNQATDPKLSDARVGDLRWAKAPGKNTLIVNPVLRTRGGEVRTCAGQPARILPVGHLTLNMVRNATGTDQGGGLLKSTPLFSTNPEVWAAFSTRVICDSAGNATFDSIPDGDYFVFARVTWGAVAGYRYTYLESQGGVLVGRVVVSGGGVRHLVLTAE